MLHPDVVLRGDFAPATATVRVQGAAAVAKLARSYAAPLTVAAHASRSGPA
ncbi:hypothetical protein MAHJHV57_51880 [Mycobacterium avium subsp. hominissuis]